MRKPSLGTPVGVFVCIGHAAELGLWNRDFSRVAEAKCDWSDVARE